MQTDPYREETGWREARRETVKGCEQSFGDGGCSFPTVLMASWVIYVKTHQILQFK